MKKNTMLIVLAFAGLLAAAYGVRVWRQQGAAAPASIEKRYYCPMHPTFRSDKPGTCPICNMALVADEAPVAAPGIETKGSAKHVCVLHKCTMADCQMELETEAGKMVSCPVCGEAETVATDGKPLYYRNPHNPAMTSPTPRKDEMGMDYVPVYADESAPSGVPGQGAITVNEERRRQIGLKSEPVQRRDLAVIVRATGQVAYDPELYHAINEYSEAVKARDAVKGSPYPDVHQRAQALVQASEVRLRQMGLSQSQLERLAKSPEPPTNLLFGGPGGTVWVYAQVYEYEIPLVKPGQAVDVTTLAYPGRKFRGTVRSIDPIVSAETRSLRVRIEVPNPDGRLSLQMYVDANIRAGLGRLLSVPSTAVMDTGTRKIVFVDLGAGRLEPREVQLGRQAENYHEVLSGLKEGERVVTSANFLIDSESRLKAPREHGH